MPEHQATARHAADAQTVMRQAKIDSKAASSRLSVLQATPFREAVEIIALHAARDAANEGYLQAWWRHHDALAGGIT